VKVHLHYIIRNLKKDKQNVDVAPPGKISADAYDGRHDSCHVRHFGGGTKIAWQKLKFRTDSFFNLYFASHTTINCTAA